MSGLTFKIKRFPFLSFFFSSPVHTRHGSYKELGSLLFSSRSIQTSRISKSNRSRNEPNSNIGLVWHSRAHQAYTRPSSVNDGYTASHPLTRELFFFQQVIDVIISGCKSLGYQNALSRPFCQFLYKQLSKQVTNQCDYTVISSTHQCICDRYESLVFGLHNLIFA